ncbi:MAG TPA: flagellar biosynthesis protein FlgJ, partial [Rhodospirillaceae bacterium]|nr:flagellar biosynthesis protein FlgJ [Rhodospirillaceae bacterium]
LVKEYASMLTENGGVGLAQDIRSQLIEIQSAAYKGE